MHKTGNINEIEKAVSLQMLNITEIGSGLLFSPGEVSPNAI